MLNQQNYHDEQNMQNILKMRAVLETLPSFCKTFFRGIEDYTSVRTRLGYAYDLRLFFEYLHEQNSIYAKMDIRDFPFSMLDDLTRMDIEEYMDYISLYQKEGKNITNDERGKSRKLAALRSFYNYFYKTEMLRNNPAALVSLPKLHEKEIVRLDVDEVANTVFLRFEDEGTPYNPLAREDPDITLGAEERGVGGLGIYMTKKSMDDVEYSYENGKNILVITKKIK